MDEKMPLIEQQLASSDSEVRLAATRQLAALAVPSMQLFGLSLGDPDWRVRKAAIETFFQLDQIEAFIPDLIKFLYHPENAGLRNAAIEILIGLGPRAVPALRHELVEPDVEVRKFVIDILGEIGDPRCGEELVHALADSDINVRYAAVETLGKIRFEAAVDPLLELMSDPDPGLKFTILESLSQIGGTIPIERLLLHLDDRLLRKALFDCFAKVGGPEVIPSLVNGLSDPMRHVREAALYALERLRAQETDTIKEILAVADADQIAAGLELIISGDNLQLKEAALTLYGSVGTTRDLSLLLNCVGDEALRALALRAFCELGEEPFARLVQAHDALEPLQLLCLIFVGGELGFSQVLPLAIDAARSAEPQLRAAAARSIGRLGGEEQFDPLLRMLDDEISEIQDTAAAAIAAFAKRYKDIALLRISPLLAAQDADKRMRAVRILGLIEGDEVEVQLLKAFKDSSVSVRCEAIRALKGHFSDVVISGLTLALTDESAEVRRLAVSALGQCPQAKALTALTLAAGDSDLWVRATVMRVLVHFSGDVVRELLLQGAADPVGPVVVAALESSVGVLPEECRQLLGYALTHPDAEVVKAAMSLLSRVVGTDWIGPFCPALLSHPHRDVRLQAVRALGQSGLADANRLLAARLEVETDAALRQALTGTIATLAHTAGSGC